MAYLVTCISVIVAALLGVLMLNIQMDTGAFTANDLQNQLTQLNRTQAQLTGQLAAADSPYALAAKAQKLGMISAASVAYLSLQTGQILVPPQPPAPAATPTPSASATPAAKSSASNTTKSSTPNTVKSSTKSTITAPKTAAQQ